MTTNDLAYLVKRMRDAQKNYFRTRAPEVLGESKKLEREVDAAVKGVLEPPAPTLFDDEDGAAKGVVCRGCLNSGRNSLTGEPCLCAQVGRSSGGKPA